MKQTESNVSAGPISWPSSRLPPECKQFPVCLGAYVRGKLDLTEQRQTLFLEPVSTSLPSNRARNIPDLMMENMKRLFKSLLKN